MPSCPPVLRGETVNLRLNFERIDRIYGMTQDDWLGRGGAPRRREIMGLAGASQNNTGDARWAGCPSRPKPSIPYIFKMSSISAPLAISA
jgi:hypothetical protein